MSRVLLGMLAALMLTVAMPTSAVAIPQTPQATEQVTVEPPRPRRADRAPVLWSYGAVILLLVLVFGANTIPSRRGHQD